MIRYLFVLLLALATAAFGQTGPSGATSRGNALKRPEYATYSDLSFFVSPSGNDANDCASVGTPCLTVQSVMNRIPKLIRHGVTVTLAAGNYPGFTVEGFTIENGSTGGNSFLLLTAALTTFVPATSTATGTFTAVANGSGRTYGVVTDNTKTWTVNNLKRQLLEIVSGTGAGTIVPIVSNTATTITVAGSLATATGATYAIRDWGAVVNTPVARALTPQGTAGTLSYVNVASNRNTANTTINTSNIVIKNLKIAGATASPGLAIRPGNRIQVLNSRIEQPNTGSSACIQSAGSYLQVDKSVIYRPISTNGSGLDLTGDGGLILQNNLIDGSFAGIRFASIGTLSTLISANQLTNFGGAGFNIFGLGGGQFSYTRFECAAGASAITNNGLSNTQTVFGDGWVGVDSDATGCTSVVTMTGNVVSRMFGTWSGSTNNYVAMLNLGAKLMIDSTVTLTGTTADIALNTTTTYSLATMRAATPRKIVSDLSDSTAAFEN